MYTRNESMMRSLAMRLKTVAARYAGRLSVCVKRPDKQFVRNHRLGNLTFMLSDDSGVFRYSEKELADPFNVDEIIAYTEKFFAHGLARYIRSAQAEDHMDPGYEVVGNTFDRLVLETQKMVVLRLYNRSLQFSDEQINQKEKWGELRERYRYSKKVLVCEMEMSENDLPPRIAEELRAYRAGIFFFPKDGSKALPYPFTGRLITSEMIECIEKATREDTVISQDLYVKTDL